MLTCTFDLLSKRKSRSNYLPVLFRFHLSVKQRKCGCTRSTQQKMHRYGKRSVVKAENKINFRKLLKTYRLAIQYNQNAIRRADNELFYLIGVCVNIECSYSTCTWTFRAFVSFFVDALKQ